MLPVTYLGRQCFCCKCGLVPLGVLFVCFESGFGGERWLWFWKCWVCLSLCSLFLPDGLCGCFFFFFSLGGGGMFPWHVVSSCLKTIRGHHWAAFFPMWSSGSFCGSVGLKNASFYFYFCCGGRFLGLWVFGVDFVVRWCELKGGQPQRGSGGTGNPLAPALVVIYKYVFGFSPAKGIAGRGIKRVVLGIIRLDLFSLYWY